MSQSFETDVSADFPFVLQRVEVLDSYMTYIDTGSPQTDRKEVALFLHGNPASSYIWRNIIPHVSPTIRCIAPDLIGMGQSGKPSIPYHFINHAEYLAAFISAILPTEKLTLVVHDWGSALGLNWAFLNQSRVSRLVLSEFVRPYLSWNELAGPAQTMFKKFRDPAEGRRMIIEENMFVEQVLTKGMFRTLTEAEHDHYRAPFLKKAAREPVYRWPNEIPIEGHPKDVWDIVERYHDWLLVNDIPKLFFWAKPGRIIMEEKAKWYLETLREVKGVCVGDGLHFLEEDHPHKMGTEIAAWL
ncbi:putative Haloalkane dehalogenase [Stipitochalara longipes BDJ]|nr:putative Haloalkane dehalogenase [Stipitochalara longipes BDJ]